MRSPGFPGCRAHFTDQNPGVHKGGEGNWSALSGNVAEPDLVYCIHMGWDGGVRSQQPGNERSLGPRLEVRPCFV